MTGPDLSGPLSNSQLPFQMHRLAFLQGQITGERIGGPETTPSDAPGNKSFSAEVFFTDARQLRRTSRSTGIHSNPNGDRILFCNSASHSHLCRPPTLC